MLRKFTCRRAHIQSEEIARLINIKWVYIILQQLNCLCTYLHSDPFMLEKEFEFRYK